MKRILLIVGLTMTTSFSFSQEKQDIVDYLKSRIELYSERPATLKVTSCNISVYNTMVIIGNPKYTLEMSCALNDLMDVMYVNDKQVWITLKFRNKNVSYTDIEQDGTKRLWKYDDTIDLFFSKGTINDEEAKKIVELFEKLGKMCDAKILDL